MAHTCDDCDEQFGTLSALRLHDCAADTGSDDAELDEHLEEVRRLQREEDSAARRKASDTFVDALDRAQDGDHGAVHRALALYEQHLTVEWRTEEDHYWGFQRAFWGRTVEALDGAVAAQGWPFLLDVLDAYWPEVTFDATHTDGDSATARQTDYNDFEDYAHVSHVLTTVTGMWLVRTRRTEGLGHVPVEALDFLRLFHAHPDETGAWVDSAGYGWGIGHPDHPVDDSLERMTADGFEIWASSAIEHALHADQYAAVTLLEDLFAAGVVPDPWLFLRAPGSLDRGDYPGTSDHWDWEAIYPEFADGEFDWDPTVRDRLRALAEDTGVVAELPPDWTLGDIVL